MALQKVLTLEVPPFGSLGELEMAIKSLVSAAGVFERLRDRLRDESRPAGAPEPSIKRKDYWAHHDLAIHLHELARAYMPAGS